MLNAQCAVLDAQCAMPREQHRTRSFHSALSIALLSSACATVPPPRTPAAPPPVLTWQEKLTWILRLEDQRILRDPSPPPPAVLVPAGRNLPAIVAPAPPSDLLRLLGDEEAGVRRRAALAVGRVGLPEGIDPLVARLADEEPEVRRMAAFALGLIGDRAAVPALLMALADPSPMVQGRAAEALGLVGDRANAGAVSAMVQAHVKAGALANLDPDDLRDPLAPAADAARLGLYALARLGSYEALAAAALDAAGQPVSRWWPLAYALQRMGDARAAPALLTLLTTPGRFTAAFAARGLGTTRAASGAAPLRQLVDLRTAPRAVVVQAMRALAAVQDAAAGPVLGRIIADQAADPALRLEALAAVGTIRAPDLAELLVDLLSDQMPSLRAGAIRALAFIDADAFLLALSGLDTDRDWTVRVALAGALGTLPAERAGARLLAMLTDPDPRTTPAILNALVAMKSPEAERVLLERLTADDFVIRSTAATGLADLKSAAVAPALARAYRAGVGERTYVARAAALAALNRLDPAAARPVLEDALRDREGAVRVRAAALLRESGVATLASEPRPAVAGRPADAPEWRPLLEPPYSPHAYIDTDRGTIEIELAVLDAPQTALNFMTLARARFFDGLAIHRVVADFVVQGGDPRGDGDGGPGYTIRDELNQRPFLRGTVGMALDWKDTGGSQFFITHSPQPHLDARYTVFGDVVNGMDVVDRITPGDVIRHVRIWDGVSMTP